MAQTFNQTKLASYLKLTNIRRAGAVCTACAFIALSSTSYASGVNTKTTDKNIYGVDYFMPFEPQTLYDILEKIPDANTALIAMNNGEQNRGFGSSGDQILINSKRVSGKENNLRKELDNIRARDVEYVELIRGTRSGLDVQSEGLVVNVILKKEIDSSILWTVAAVKTSSMTTKPEGSVVYSNGDGDFKYRLGVSRNASPTKLTREDFYRNTDNVLTDKYTRVRENWYVEDQLTSKVEYNFSDATAMQLSGLYAWIYVDAEQNITHNNYLTNEDDLSIITIDWQRKQWEISGDITHQLNEANNLKLLFIGNRADSNDQTWKTSFFDAVDPSLEYQLPRLNVASENVIRTNWSSKLDSKHSLDLGGEAAVNQLEENLQFISFDSSPYHSTEINDIEEKRYELFSNYNFAMSPKLNLQASLIYERSTMTVNTDFRLVSDSDEQAQKHTSRTFSYLKPRFNVRYDIDDLHQIRFNYERTASQLNLRDFVPEFNRDETRLEETNPNLKPEVRDKLSFSIEKQWQSTNGSITLTPYYHDISDLIVEVPLSEYSGDGNIDSGKEYGVKLETNFGLDALGLENTLISANYTWRESEMTHPFTGESSDIELLSDNDWQLKINQNEVLPGLSFNLTLSNRSPYRYTRHDFQGTRKNEIKGRGFIEYQISKQLKLRLAAARLFNHKSDFLRTRYEGRFTETDILRYEHRFDRRAPRYILTLSGQF